MKKWLPWILTGVFALWVVSTLRPPKPVNGFEVDEFGEIPVLLNGRVQPFDSVARNSLLAMRGKSTARLQKGEPAPITGEPLAKAVSIPATEWLLEVMLKPELADNRKVFLVHHVELKGMLELDQDRKFFSFEEMIPHFQELEKEAQRVRGIDAQLRTHFDKQVASLHQALGIYHRLKNSFRPEGSEDFLAELELYQKSIGPGVAALQSHEAGRQYDSQDLDLIVRFFRRYQLVSRIAYPMVMPPLDPKQEPDAWSNIGATLMQAMQKGEIHPAAFYFARMSNAYRQNKPQVFNQAVADYKQWLDEKDLDKALAKGHWEYFFNRFEPFYKSMVIYVAALLLGCAYWLNWTPWVRKSALGLIMLTFVIHTAGLIFRMVLEGRPPVTNLYSSAIFVGWGAVLLGIVLERFFKDGIGVVTASGVGFITLIVAHHLSLSGDTMEMLRAVLDTNFWLATHVVIITAGYSAMFLAGFLAIIYILRGLFTKTLTQATAKSLSRMVYGIICFATLFSFVGTVLGGIWADQSWGRFWGWDPKENGALLIVIWCAIILHARWGGIIRDRGLMAMAIFGNIVTSFSWFGTNMLGIGLHSYGFMDAAFFWLITFMASQALLIGLCMLPERFWLSFRTAPGTPGQSPAQPVGGKPKPALS